MGVERVIVGRLAEQIHRHDGFGLERTVLLHQRDRGLKACRIHVEGVGQDIHEHRRGTRQRHHFRGSGEGEGRHEHRIARTDAPGAQDQEQRVGAIGAGDGVLHAGPLRDVLFELRHLRTQNPLAAFHSRLDGSLQRRAQAAALGLQIDKGDGVGHECSAR